MTTFLATVSRVYSTMAASVYRADAPGEDARLYGLRLALLPEADRQRIRTGDTLRVSVNEADDPDVIVAAELAEVVNMAAPVAAPAADAHAGYLTR